MKVNALECHWAPSGVFFFFKNFLLRKTEPHPDFHKCHVISAFVHLIIG